MKRFSNSCHKENEKLRKQAALSDEQESICEIRRLVNLDFSWLYHYTKDLEQTQKTLKTSVDNPDFVSSLVKDADGLKVLERHFSVDFKFFFWDVLLVSHALTRLPLDEAERIVYLHDTLVAVDVSIKKAFSELAAVSKQASKEGENCLTHFKNSLCAYLETITVGCNLINMEFDSLGINWIDLDLFLKELRKQTENNPALKTVPI